MTTDAVEAPATAYSDGVSEPAPRITLIGKPGCHLCDLARTVIATVAEETGAGWEERSVLDDDALLEEYAELVPVTLVDGRRHDYWRVDASRLRAALEV